jgi:twitching motility two-component system response regulator PilH
MPISKILVVDDSPTDRTYVSELLASSGYQVITANDGTEGVEKAHADRPDLVLMDVVMPGINGFQATRAISTSTDTKHIPVIICTTKNQETDKVWGMRQGARDYLVKPINRDELLGKIQSLAVS